MGGRWFVGFFWALAAGSLSLQDAKADDRITVAVSYFDNTSKDDKLDPLKKGLAEMLITDLSISSDIKMVERERLNDVLKEVELQKSPYMDQSSAAKLGKGLGAAYIVTGSYIVSGDTMRVDCRMVDVETSEVVIAAKADGKTTDFLSIERSLATQLLEGLGGSLSLIQKKKIGAGGTGSLKALTSYSDGLDALDAGDTKKAAAAIQKALDSDPDFKAAHELKGRIDELAKAFDLSLYESQIGRVSNFLAGNKCPCSYAKPLEEIESKSYGTRIGNRIFDVGQMGLGWSGPMGATISLKGPLDLAQLGQVAQAQRLLEAMISEDFIAAGTGQAKNGLIVHVDPAIYRPMFTCTAYQVRSYIHLQQLELEEAMKWQVKSAELPDGPHKASCLSGATLELSFGLSPKSPIKDQIQEAIDDPKVFANRKARLAALNQMSGKVWKQVETALENPPSCEELCPWSVDGEPVQDAF